MTRTGAQREAQRVPQTPEQVIRQNRRRVADAQDAASFFRKLVAIVAMVVMLFGFLFGVTVMGNNDMKPKLAAGDLLLYYRLEQYFVRNDVVVFDVDGTEYVGRVIGMPGDSVEITADKELLINGSRIEETEIYYPTPMYSDAVTYAIDIGSDEYFVLCDQRETAKDSRYFGPVRSSDIKGKVVTALRRADI